MPGKDPKDAPPHDATKPQKPLVAPIPLAPGENRTLSQRPSANKTATGDYADAASGRPSGQENIPPDTQADQLRTAMEDLALERTPEPVRGRTADQGTTGNAAGKDAPQVLPVPLIVPYPGVNKQATPKGPGSPALLGPTLPGLIEPKTEEERKEREYHRSFMREALGMVSLSTLGVQTVLTYSMLLMLMFCYTRNSTLVSLLLLASVSGTSIAVDGILLFNEDLYLCPWKLCTLQCMLLPLYSVAQLSRIWLANRR